MIDRIYVVVQNYGGDGVFFEGFASEAVAERKAAEIGGHASVVELEVDRPDLKTADSLRADRAELLAALRFAVGAIDVFYKTQAKSIREILGKYDHADADPS